MRSDRDWNAEEGARQLVDAYRAAGMDEATFAGDRFMRLSRSEDPHRQGAARRRAALANAVGAVRPDQAGGTRHDLHRDGIAGRVRHRPRAAGGHRGYFARAFCQHELADHGLKPVIAQANVAFNQQAGTLRGMHFQFPPKPETKIVRCTRGAILDIIVDLRPESPTYLENVSVELD